MSVIQVCYVKGFTSDQRALRRAYYDYRQVVPRDCLMKLSDYLSLRVMISHFEVQFKSDCAFTSREYRRLIRLFKQGKVEEIKAMVACKKLERL